MCAVLTVRRFPKGTFEEALKTSLSTSTPLSLDFFLFLRELRDSACHPLR